MQELTIQDFYTIVEAIADRLEAEGVEMTKPFTTDGLGYLTGLESFKGDLLLKNGVVIYSEDGMEIWIPFYGMYYETLDKMIDDIWAEYTSY